MSEIDQLLTRIDAEFATAETHLKAYQDQQVHEYEGRLQRLEQLDQVFMPSSGNTREKIRRQSGGDFQNYASRPGSDLCLPVGAGPDCLTLRGSH
jgi:inorganic triphosphatase YgiF